MPYTTVLTEMPDNLYAGDSISWKFGLSDYPADSWTLTYSLVKADKQITITGDASGTDHLVELTAAITAKYPMGDYAYQAYVTHSNGERYMVREGTVKVHANFATATKKQIDTRSHAKRMLDAIEAVSEKKATKDQLSYSIAGRSITKLTPAEIIEWRNYYQAEYNKEINLEKRKQGKRTGSRVKVRFS